MDRRQLAVVVPLATHVLAFAAGAPADMDRPRPELLYEDASRHLSANSFGNQGELLLTRTTADFSSAELLAVAYPPRAGDTPRPLALDGDAKGAAFVGQGAALFFTSSRPTGLPIASDAWNLWVASLDGGEPGLPTPLPFPVNSPFAECCAAAAPNRALLFASDRAGTWDVYRAEPAGAGAWRVARLPGRVNTEESTPGERGYFGEWPSFVEPRGRFLLFSSIRPGGLGGDDVFVACRSDDGGWGEPRNLGAPVNGPGYEDGAIVTPAGDALLWSSRREGETSRVYRLPFEAAQYCPEGGAAP